VSGSRVVDLLQQLSYFFLRQLRLYTIVIASRNVGEIVELHYAAPAMSHRSETKQEREDVQHATCKLQLCSMIAMTCRHFRLLNELVD
jgi:hypothetical protein